MVSKQGRPKPAIMGMNPEISPTNPVSGVQHMNDVGFRVILIPFLGIAIPLATRMIPHSLLTLWQVKLSYLYTIGIAFIVWQGNRYLLFTLRSYFNWFNHPIRKIGALLLVIPFYTIPISVLMLTGWYHLFLHGEVNWNVVMQSTLIILIAVVFIVHVYETVFLVKESEKEMLLNTQLERARTEAALQALKNQIDPHFIFNSLNTLSHLIEASPQKARKFNDNMAEVYRYILHNKGRDLVMLSEEMSFLRNYFDLLKIRFEEGLQLDNRVSREEEERFLVPPISLQLLMENAIKHNDFGPQHPLRISLQLDHGTLVFSNRTREKITDRNSNGIGLANLRERYKMVTSRDITISVTDNEFSIRMPLLNLD
jgi:hypothetical protein